MEAVMKRCCWGLLLLLLVSVAQAVPVDNVATVSGAADRDIPAWTLRAPTPDGWTQDCCMYAKAIGVNLVMYKGEWTGEPERVIVLNVWNAKLSSLEAELQDDRHRYLERDPAGKASVFAVDNKTVNCRGVLFEGSDHKDDAVVFCDPGLASGIRFSWSLTLAHDDAQKADLLALFRHVAEQSQYTGQASAGQAAAKMQH
jgi:hypothetical protein